MTPATRIPIAALLTSLDACQEAITWATPYGLDYERAWAECRNPSWITWLGQHLDIDDRTWRLVACEIARDVLPLFEKCLPGDNRPRLAIEAGEAFSRGEITAAARAAAWDAAWAAARDAARAAAGDAARAAAGDAADLRYCGIIRKHTAGLVIGLKVRS